MNSKMKNSHWCLTSHLTASYDYLQSYYVGSSLGLKDMTHMERPQWTFTMGGNSICHLQVPERLQQWGARQYKLSPQMQVDATLFDLKQCS